MKKKLSILLIITCLISPITKVTASSHTHVISNVIAEGIYAETTIELLPSVSTRSTSISTISGKKTNTYKNSSGEVLWTISVIGTFNYNGTSSSCINSTVSTSVSNNNWRITSASASKSGASAKATATAKKYLNGICTQKVTQNVTLSCSKTGKLY